MIYSEKMPASRNNKLLNWINASSVRMLIIGVVLALGATSLIFMVVMQPPVAELTQLVRTLGASSIVSLAIGYFLYRNGFSRSPSLSLTLVLTYVWAAGLTLFNVWAMAQLMFANEHDFTLAIILLIFAGLIATSFGIFVSANVTNGLRQLADTACAVAEGDFSTRVEIRGRDEVAQAGVAFNEMARQLEMAAKEREEVEAMRRDLIAWVSHDLRTPLTSIRALVETLHDGVVTDEETKQRYYRTIRADVLSLNDLIDDLFELAQLDAGLKLEIEPQSLSDLISDSLERFQALAETKGVTVVGDVSPDLDPVPMNVSKMGRVLSNVISNAIKYTPAGGTVALHATRENGQVRVTVQDSGEGFKKEDLSRIFEKFYRGEEARTRAMGGAGLGLAIAHSIVEAHGGRIWAENSEDGGAIVGWEMPA
jgi:signal transduction histidine kinase